MTVRSTFPPANDTKRRLTALALAAFAARGYDGVAVTDVAARAGVTVGSLYHHFGSKLGLYEAVRADAERRVLDRLEGAWAATPDLGRALLAGFDHVVEQGLALLLSEAWPDGSRDGIESFLAIRTDVDGLPVGHLLTATWRAALAFAVKDPSRARGALAVLVRPSV